MKINPVYRQESKISARSFRLPLIVLVCNSILALVALLDMYSMITQVKTTAEIQYSSFLNLYIFAAAIEFVMLLLIVPALTAGSISGERERQTLNLLLTTRITPADIVLGKLMSSLSTVFLLVVSSFPILALVFVYGGVTGRDIVLLLVSFASTALLAGSVGICCSSVFKRTTIATAASYCIMAALVFGTVALQRFAASFQVPGNRSAKQGPVWLLLVNPAVTFLSAMKSQLSNVRRSSAVEMWIGNGSLSVTARWWLGISAGVQVLMAALCLWLAVRQVNPRRKRLWKG